MGTVWGKAFSPLARKKSQETGKETENMKRLSWHCRTAEGGKRNIKK